jgi:hypothetical protein
VEAAKDSKGLDVDVRGLFRKWQEIGANARLRNFVRWPPALSQATLIFALQCKTMPEDSELTAPTLQKRFVP